MRTRIDTNNILFSVTTLIPSNMNSPSPYIHTFIHIEKLISKENLLGKPLGTCISWMVPNIKLVGLDYSA